MKRKRGEACCYWARAPHTHFDLEVLVDGGVPGWCWSAVRCDALNVMGDRHCHPAIAVWRPGACPSSPLNHFADPFGPISGLCPCPRPHAAPTPAAPLPTPLADSLARTPPGPQPLLTTASLAGSVLLRMSTLKPVLPAMTLEAPGHTLTSPTVHTRFSSCGGGGGRRLQGRGVAGRGLQMQRHKAACNEIPRVHAWRRCLLASTQHVCVRILLHT